jgi:hypothetical protein
VKNAETTNAKIVSSTSILRSTRLTVFVLLSALLLIGVAQVKAECGVYDRRPHDAIGELFAVAEQFSGGTDSFRRAVPNQPPCHGPSCDRAKHSLPIIPMSTISIGNPADDALVAVDAVAVEPESGVRIWFDITSIDQSPVQLLKPPIGA